MSKRRILLVFPIFQAMYPRPFQRYAEVLISAGRQEQYIFGVLTPERQSLVSAMNDLGERMCREDWDACIVFDDDCYPPHDVVPRLLKLCFEDGHKFVTATGLMRGFPFTTTVATYYPEGVTGVVGPSGRVEQLSGFRWLDDFPEELKEADFAGLPAAIIHRSCFTQIAPPWFADLDEMGQRITHDVYFCRKLKEAGIPVMVDGRIRCGHLVDAPIITFENRPSTRVPVEP